MTTKENKMTFEEAMEELDIEADDPLFPLFCKTAEEVEKYEEILYS